MKIGIIGSGNMGSGLARRIAASGHDVLLTSRDLIKTEKLGAQIGGRVKVVSPASVANGVDVLIAATPSGTQLDALKSAGDLTGKIVVDISNPLTPDYSGLTVGFTSSFAEELAKALPGARIVKAFNTVFAAVLNEGADFGNGQRAAAFYCTDDEGARKTVHGLITSMGFDAVDSGPLANARYLEPMGFLNIWFGFMAKGGTGIAPTWLHRVGTAAGKRAA